MSLTQEEIKERKNYIGSSDAANVVGLGYKTPVQVWLEKTGQVEPEDISQKDAIIFGNLLEEVIASEYERRTGMLIHKIKDPIIHPTYSFIQARPDRKVMAPRKKILEIKTVGRNSVDQWGEPGTDQIPVSYLLQVQHQLAVTGAESADMAVLITGNDFRIYPVPRNEEMIEFLIRAEVKFWACVLDKTPPQIKTLEDAKKLYPKSLPKPIEATLDLALTVEELKKVKNHLKYYEETEEDLKTKIAEYMKENDTLTCNGKDILTYKTEQGSSFDTKKIQSELPELCKKYYGSYTKRVLRVKK